MKIVVIHNSYQRPGVEDVVVAAERCLLRDRPHQVVSYRRSNHELEQMSKPRQLPMVRDIVYFDHSKRERNCSHLLQIYEETISACARN